jgi:oxygen-independent coproporphyrinogen-3 oxidase
MMIFETVNLDLMYALPGQTLADAKRDLEIALQYSPPHLSFYHLTIEPNTLFHRYPPTLPDEDVAADMEESIDAALARSGYFHYETSAYAQPSHECRHNINYWRFGDYLGIGAGAHSKISFADAIVRQMRWKQPQQYLARVAKDVPVQEEAEVTRADVGFEFMLNALRLAEGVPTALFSERTGFSLSLVSREIEIATRKGLLEPDPTVIKPTEMGRRFLERPAADLLAGFQARAEGRRIARASRGDRRRALRTADGARPCIRERAGRGHPHLAGARGDDGAPFSVASWCEERSPFVGVV